MTRINVGICVEELCDQQLKAEYRELPRAIGKKYKKKPPKQFKLKTGHESWCAQYQISLVKRYNLIVSEMLYRGFTVNYPNPKMPINDKEWLATDEERARPLLMQRINERLSVIQNPKWTKRVKPDWAIV